MTWRVYWAEWLRESEDGVARLHVHDGQGYGRSCLWTTAVLRKPTNCMVCTKALPPKTRAYTPMANYLFRMERICLECMERECRRTK
jgi:hypothetical protein